MRYVDLSHVISEKTPVYPGDPQPVLSQTATLEKHGFNDFSLATGMHVGTHIDGPFHMLRNGRKLFEYTPEHFFGKGHLIDARGKNTIDIDLLQGLSLTKREAILVWTGHERWYNTDAYFTAYPTCSAAFAEALIAARISMVGFDCPSPDRAPYAIHKQLFEHDILIIENLASLHTLADTSSFEVIALPIKIQADSAPARVIARIGE